MTKIRPLKAAASAPKRGPNCVTGEMAVLGEARVHVEPFDDCQTSSSPADSAASSSQVGISMGEGGTKNADRKSVV